MCGGIFVSALNQTTTRCSQGTDEPECYVPEIDFSTFDGPGDSKATVMGAMTPEFDTARVVLQGTMSPAVLRFGSLRVHMAWIANDSLPIGGDFFAARSNGIVCVIAPCPSYDQELLNRSTVRSFHGFDFTDVPPHADDSTFTGPALQSSYGLIIAGDNIIDEDAGRAGPATILKATQVFIPVLARVVDPGRRPRFHRAELPSE